MSDTVSANSVIAEITTDIIKSSFNSILDGATGAMKSAWTKIFEDFAPYAQHVHRRTSLVKILCVKEHDVSLNDIYVNSLFSCGSTSYSDTDLIHKIREGQNVIINGNGGAGKTFFMRQLWLTLFENAQGVMPIFIELRALNSLSTYDLKSHIRLTIASSGHLTDSVFDYFCKIGRFCFVLDGFDEVPEERREALQSDILSMSANFRDCTFVVSSRPDKRFSGWQHFIVCKSMPFTRSQTIELINKVPFDPPSKRLFVKNIDDKFFEEHKSFLSNPLLAIMMLMTFKENMDIPKSMNIFYDQAFTTLFVWHDATKAYTRKKAMDIEEFRRSFGLFCLFSYYEERYEFTESELYSYITKSTKVLNYRFNPTEIAKDYTESVNLLQQDGLKYVFIHRSFQEYFAAYAVTSILADKLSYFIESFSKRPFDNAIQMAYEMNNELVTKEYIRPQYEKHLLPISTIRNDAEPFGIFVESDIDYTLRYVGSVTEGDKHRTGMYMERHPHNHLTNFLSIALKIKSSQFGFIDNPLHFGSFADRLFVALHELTRNKRKLQTISIRAHFSMTDLIITLDEYEGPERGRAALERDLASKIEALTPRAIEVAQEFYKVVDEVRRWCVERVADSESRGRSIDEILGL